MAIESDRGNLVHGGNYITHDGAYVSVVPGQECECNCCEEWYVFRRDDGHDIHWYTTGGGIEPGVSLDTLYPTYVAICANTFLPTEHTEAEYFANDGHLSNSPDVRFHENFIYGSGGPDARGQCGLTNVWVGEQGVGTWRGPVFYHVTWYFQVNFAGTTWPLANGWPRGVYQGTLTNNNKRTSQQIVDWNNSNDEKIEFVFREPSTGVHNCQNANCSNWYMYKREYEAVGTGAYLELEMHWGCRPILCTGDYQIVPDPPDPNWLYDVTYEDVPCGMGCQTLDPNVGIYWPYETACLFGNFGGTFPAVWELFTSLDGVYSGEDPINNPGAGSQIPYGRMNVLSVALGPPQYRASACSYKPISTFWQDNFPNSGVGVVPDYHDPVFLDPDTYAGFHHSMGYFTTANSTGKCGCISSDCVREFNPGSEGFYKLEPVPFISYSGLRMFVDLIPQVGDEVEGYSIYLDYLSDKEKATEFIFEHSERIVFDSRGNQYLVSLPYGVDLSTDGQPHYPDLTRKMPRLLKEPMVRLNLAELSELVLEFDFVCMYANPGSICSLNLNVVLQPKDLVLETAKTIRLQDGYEFSVKSEMVNGLVMIEVEVPYGLGTGLIKKTIRPICYVNEGCTHEVVSQEDLRGTSLNIVSIGYVD